MEKSRESENPRHVNCQKWQTSNAGHPVLFTDSTETPLIWRVLGLATLLEFIIDSIAGKMRTASGLDIPQGSLSIRNIATGYLCGRAGRDAAGLLRRNDETTGFYPNLSHYIFFLAQNIIIFGRDSTNSQTGSHTGPTFPSIPPAMASKRAAASTLSCITRLGSAPAQSLKTTTTTSRFLNHFVQSYSSQYQRPVPLSQQQQTQQRGNINYTPIRQKHTIPRPRSQPSSSPEPQSPPSDQQQPAQPKRDTSQVPQYELTFTCIPCDHRSKHKVSKQGYHHGSVLISCPNCRNRHVISDHLKLFGDRKVTVEDLLKEKGMMVKRGTLGEDGDVEFWEDGTSTMREPEPEPAPERPKKEVDNSPPGSTFKNVRPGEGKKDGDESN
ncbi:zf-DNL-domain-containing protein [Neurospora crassa]|nr:zf-DNL-domain-containing protein [Neurospora crassa]